MTAPFYVVAAVDDVKEGQQMHVELDGEQILLCNHQGEYYAIAYYCSHAEFPLDGGSMTNHCITCPYHGAEFDMRDGSVLSPPAFEGIKTYGVKVENNTIAVSSEPSLSEPTPK